MSYYRIAHLHAGQHQAITDEVGGVTHALARFETEREIKVLSPL